MPLSVTSFQERNVDKDTKWNAPTPTSTPVDDRAHAEPGKTAPRPGLWFYFGWALAVLLAAGMVGGLLLARSSKLANQIQQLKQEEKQGRRVLVQPILHPPATRSIELPATLRGYTETPIYAKVAGYLKTIHVDKGDRVKKGQILALLDSPELDQQVANARATYNLDVLTDDRYQKLAADGVLSRQTADESHNAMLAAKATLDQFQAMEAYKTITAPFAGVVTARYVDPGALIPQATSGSGGTPLLALATLSPLRVYADVPQSLAPYVRDGDPASITVSEFPGRVFQGRITRHPEALAATTRTMLVEVDLPNDEHRLYPGMYARLSLQASAGIRSRMVPDDALVFREGKPYVPVVRNNILRLVPVQLGYDDGIQVEVAGDVTDQDVVALNVGQAAHDGERVQPVSAQQ